MSLNEEIQTSIEICALNKAKNTIEKLIQTDSSLIPLKKLLATLEPNPNPNDSPDFIMPAGYLEHFTITSSRENRNGAKHTEKRKKFEKTGKKIEEQLSPECPFVSHTFRYPEHSHGYLLASLKRNIDGHLQKLKKYTEEKAIGIFLIEYSEDNALSMGEIITNESDPMFGNPSIIDHYIFQRDRKMIEVLSTYGKQVKYVIFLKSIHMEIVDLEKIPDTIKRLQHDYVILPDIGSVERESWSYVPLTTSYEDDNLS